MSMVPVHSVSDFRFHTLKISAYFLENKTTAFMVQRAQVKVYAVKQSSPYRGAFHTNKQPPQRSQHHEITVFIYSFTNPLKKKKKLDNNWKSVFGPNIFPRATPPGWKGHRSEQSPLCCLFQDHVMCRVWRANLLPCEPPRISQNSGLHWHKEGRVRVFSYVHAGSKNYKPMHATQVSLQALREHYQPSELNLECNVQFYHRVKVKPATSLVTMAASHVQAPEAVTGSLFST